MDVEQIREPAVTAADDPPQIVAAPGAVVRRDAGCAANKGVINLIDSIIYAGVAAAWNLLRSA